MAAPGSASQVLEWRTTTVGGRRAEYGVAGTGAPVVFLHGWAVTNRTYQAALNRLVARGHRVLAPALPGHGGTEPLPADEHHLRGYADWVAAFLTTVGCDAPVVLIGHSF
jgi:pimeloyl-ACP methyl ester carboxylesterase